MLSFSKLIFGDRDNNRRTEAPLVGEVFLPPPDSRSPEAARVLDRTVDQLGVWHIRFELLYRYEDRTMSGGERTLALGAFSLRFPRRAGGS